MTTLITAFLCIAFGLFAGYLIGAGVEFMRNERSKQ